MFEAFASIVVYIFPYTCNLTQSRKLQENGWKPRWFQRQDKDGPFCYTGGYWEAREQSKWDGCPNIFGEIGEDICDPEG